MTRRFSRIFFAVSGFLLVCAAIFAVRWGLDYNPGWGRGRSILLIAGFGLILISLFYPQVEVLTKRLGDKFFRLLQREPIHTWLETHPEVVDAGKIAWKHWFIIPVLGIVLVVYVWYVSLGLWTTWPARSKYYSLLAQGFLNHELSLPVKPSPQLLALSNPYDPAQRAGINRVPLDFSLYQGKFYLYWGPVPALILAALKLLTSKEYPDLYLVFGFSYGLFLIQAWLMVLIWDRYFQSLPKWILIMLLLLAGLSIPYPWMVGGGGIYEAAIAGGQFFVMAGFSAALSAIMRTSFTNLKLLLIGICWSLAIGTRLTLILPIAFLMLMVAYQLWADDPTHWSKLLWKILYLGSPVAIGLALLTWYNWARFGSLSETGFTYQLAGPYIQEHLHEVMSYRYVVQNLYNYFLAPPQIQAQFPFLFSNNGNIRSIVSFLDLPEFYNTNPITGLIYIAPFLFFSLFLMFKGKSSRYDTSQSSKADLQLAWLMNTLTGSALIALAFLLFFFWAAMRYVLDFMPMLLLLSTIGYCRGYLSAKARGRERYMATAGILVVGLSLLISLMLGISGNILILEKQNPAMLNWLIELFG